MTEFEGLLSTRPVVAHDDALVLRVQKHQAGMDDDWWRSMPPTGRVTGWYNPYAMMGEPANHGPEWAPPGEGAGPWVPMKERALNLSRDARMVAYDSMLEVRMGLWGDFRRRYRLGLEAVVGAMHRGVLRYAGAGETPKHEQEAMRNRFKRWWVVAAYEHDILVHGEVAESLMRELQADAGIPDSHKMPDTVYLKGYDSRESMLVKAYRLGKHGMPGVVKLETTFRKDYLKRHDMRQPELWGTQPEVQERVVDALKAQWRTTLKRTPHTRKLLAKELGVAQADLYDAIAGSDNTLTLIVRELERTKARVVELERRQAESERRQAEMTSQQMHNTRRLARLEREVRSTRGITAVDAEREW